MFTQVLVVDPAPKRLAGLGLSLASLDFKVLEAKLDEFVCIVRKSGRNWFIGSLTNREARSLTLDLSFLPKDKKYEATLYEDAEDSHYLYNKESYTIRKQQVNSASKLSIKMSAGGGNVIYVKDINDE